MYPIEGHRHAFSYPVELEAGNRWVFEKLWQGLMLANAEFGFDIAGFMDSFMVTHYPRGGHLGWHTDFSDFVTSARKLTISVQLSPPDDYRGGLLEFSDQGVMPLSQEQGCADLTTRRRGRLGRPMKIAVATQNPHKLAEYQAALAQHAAKVARFAGDPSQGPPDGVDLLLREESNLVEPGTRRVVAAAVAAPVVVDNLTVLTVYRAGHLPRSFEARVAGYLDPRRRVTDAQVFGWDDIFVMASTQMTYQELRARGLKRSARDQVLAAFAQEFLWFERPIELAFGDVPAARTIDFAVDAGHALAQNPFFAPLLAPRGEGPGAAAGDFDPWRDLSRVLRFVLSQGVFFRAARNRRERNYWLPGLNAGVPLTPKRDAFHEATFLMHDLMHFAFPDLLPDQRRDEAARKVYITWRLCSEAFTLVLADMLFVEGWRRAGFPYDYGARRLHPIWASGRWEGGAPQALAAAARWMLRADVSAWRAAGVAEEAIARLREKYDQYARSDWRWTGRNWHNLGLRPFASPRWLDLARALQARFGLELQTVSDAVAALEADGVALTDGAAVFEGVLGRYLARFRRLAAADGPALDEAAARSQALRRWLLGQLALCERYAFFPAAARYQAILTEQLLETAQWDAPRIAQARLLLEQLLALLQRHDIITAEERRIWAELYPLFDPFYVGYDTPSSEPLESVIAAVLDGP